MTTPLNAAPLQLVQWIEAIDIRIADLTNQRVAFANALRCFDIEHLEAAPADEPPEALIVNPPVEAAPTPRREPKSTGAETLKRKRRRTKGGPDYAEIARVYLDAVATGYKPIDTLCSHFDVERSTAKNWPTHCRKLGLLPDLMEAVHREVDRPARMMEAAA